MKLTMANNFKYSLILQIIDSFAEYSTHVSGHNELIHNDMMSGF